jgi:NAD-dependent deacetylase
MRLTPRDRLFVLTGAGISAESGLATFRGSGGLWNGYRVEEVATPEAWEANPALVWNFYSQRRRDAAAALPNKAHLALAQTEQQLGNRFYLCTQNVDDLHERAGSHRLHHMHGSLYQSRCTRCNQPFPDTALYTTAGSLPACTRCGAPVRPHIVWFGEIPLDMDGIYRELSRATVLLVVGTSGSVYPAAGFVDIANQRRIRTIYVGPEQPINHEAFDEILLGTATEVLPSLIE